MNQFIRSVLYKTNGWNWNSLIYVNTQGSAGSRCSSIQKVLTTKYTKPPPADPLPDTKTYKRHLIFISGGLLSFFSKSNDEETPEDQLIMNIKRSILSMQREEFAKSEKMLHLALRMAQDLNNKDGITYIYDLMANLALQVEQFAKAKKLFVTVMQRLLQDGYKEDDNKVI